MHTLVTAPNQFAEVGGRRLAYRRFGAENGVPLLCFQHFRGTMDYWDPQVLDGLGADRPVIVFDVSGIGLSDGDVPETFEEYADQGAGLLDGLGIAQVDVLGFSLGGYVAQAMALNHAPRVRKLVLVGTGPRGGTQEGAHPDYPMYATRSEIPTLDDFLFLFFEPNEQSQAAGRAFWERRHQRTADLDAPTSTAVMKAQLAAMAASRESSDPSFGELRRISQPTLVVNGDHDVMIPTVNSYTLQQHIPNAQLIIYPNAGHASQYQYPELFVAHARLFLDS